MTKKETQAIDPIKQHQRSVRISVLKAVGLHALLFVGLFVSFNFSPKSVVYALPSPEVEIVQASFIDSQVIEQQRRQKAQAEAAARLKRLEIQREKERQAQAREAERKRQALKKQQEAEQAAAEQARLDALEKAQQEEAKIAEERQRLAELEQALREERAEQLAQEEAQRQRAQQRRIMTEVEKYQALISQSIMRRLNTDGGFKGKSCTVNVKLASNGLVLSVTTKEGDASLCREVQSAVLRNSTLPVSSDPEVFQKMKNLNVIVRPDP